MENGEFTEAAPVKEQMEYLYSAVNRISSEQSEMKKQFSSMESMLSRMEEKLFGDDPKGKSQAESSANRPMTISRSPCFRYASPARSRSTPFHLANRESMLKKIEMPFLMESTHTNGLFSWRGSFTSTVIQKKRC
ncbi:unnamed protein product [Cochlearia groenlandica]